MTEIQKSNGPTNEDLAAELEFLVASYEYAQKRGGAMASLPEWFLGQLARFDGHQAALDENYKAASNSVAALKRKLWWNWGQQFMAQSDQDIRDDPDHEKFHRYTNGVVRYRTTGGKDTLVIDDEAEATSWASFYCPEAVKTTLSKTPLLEHAHAFGGPAPGTHVETTPKVETFYPKNPMSALPGEEQPKLEGEGCAEEKAQDTDACRNQEGDSV